MDLNKVNLIAVSIGSEYGIFNNHFLQFDSEFNISLEEEFTIKIDYNQSYVKEFFSKKISCITGVVGKNGVGKSTLIRYIRELFISKSSAYQKRENDILCFREDGSLLIYVCEKFKSNFKINNLTSSNINFKYYRDYPKIYDRLSNLTTVYYSNNLELGQIETETKNYFNISTSFLLENIGKINSNLRNKRLRSQNAHSRYHFTDFVRQIIFLERIKSYDTLDIPFKSINKVIVEISEVQKQEYTNLKKVFNRYVKEDRNSLLSYDRNEDELIEILLHKLLPDKRQSSVTNTRSRDTEAYNYEPNLNKRNLQNIILDNLYLHIFKKTLGNKELLTYLREKNKLIQLLEILSKSIVPNNEFEYDNLINRLIELIESPLILGDTSFIEFNSVVNSTIKDLEETVKFKQDVFKFTKEKDITSTTFTLSNEDQSLSSFLESYYEAAYNFKFITFRWQKLSAGEESLLAFFSRLYSLSQNAYHDNLLLLIDEGDLYFHPEWQKKYIYYLVKFFSSQLMYFSNVQIILTTHSPFLISDLPSENIIILHKHEGSSIVDILNPEHFDLETFGGNIYTLYSKAFFLGNSTTSEFAKTKINNDIIKKLESKSFEKFKNDKDLKNIINKIGEPILKQIILDKYFTDDHN